MRPVSRRGRGFTLIELMVAAVVGVIVMTGVCLTFISQVRTYQDQYGRVQAQQNARGSLNFMEELIRNAGFGVDPERVFLAYDGFSVANPAATVANMPDAFTLHTRDLDFRRNVVAATPLSLTIDKPLTQPIYQGQILLVLCSGAADWAYVTVGLTAAIGDTRIGLDNSAIVAAESPIGPPGIRFRQQGKMSGCFSSGATVTKVDRYSFFVNAYQDDPTDPSVTTPYLMLSRGLDLNGDGKVDVNDASPLAAGVEQMQVAYVLNTTEDTGSGCPLQPQVLGVNGADVPFGDAWASSGITPQLTTRYDDVSRCSNNPANIRQVRVTVVARSKRDKTQTGDSPLSGGGSGTLQDGTVVWKAAENLTVAAAPAPYKPVGNGYLRNTMRIAVSPRNLLMRAQFLPLQTGGG